jgi:hypothetical protein
MILHAQGPRGEFVRRSTAAELARNVSFMVQLPFPTFRVTVNHISTRRAQVLYESAARNERRLFRRLVLAFCGNAIFEES